MDSFWKTSLGAMLSVGAENSSEEKHTIIIIIRHRRLQVTLQRLRPLTDDRNRLGDNLDHLSHL